MYQEESMTDIKQVAENIKKESDLQKQAVPLSKQEFTPYIESLFAETKKYLPFISKTYETAKGYIFEVSHNGLITSETMKKLSKQKEFVYIDILAPNKLQVVWAKK